MIVTRRSLIKTASLLGLGSLSGFKVLSIERAHADEHAPQHAIAGNARELLAGEVDHEALRVLVGSRVAPRCGPPGMTVGR